MRKITLYILLLVFSPLPILAQQWTAEELSKANTAADVACLSNEEKDVILFINLARMYPKRYCQIECNIPGHDNSYMASLREELMVQGALEPFCFDSRMYSYAQCWASQSGRLGVTGHNRTGYCEEIEVRGRWAECCAYGQKSGREFVLQLLEDKGVPSLGHRRNLFGKYNAVGVSIAAHTQYGLCCVIDETNISNPRSQNYSHRVYNGTPLYESLPEEYTAAVTSKPTQQQQSIKQSEKQSVKQPVKQPEKQPVSTTTRTTASSSNGKSTKKTEKRSSWLQPYYDYSGKSYFSYLELGYSYWLQPITNTPHSLTDEPLDQTAHVLNLSTLDFRYSIVGLSPLQFEFGIAPLSKWVGYKPELKFYLPATKWLTVVPFTGVSVDCTYLGKYIIKDYVYTYDQDFYMSASCGVALRLTALPRIPLELKAEYHIPIRMTSAEVMPQTFSFGAKIGFGKLYK